MEVDDDVEDDDMDFNPLLREGSPSETSSSLTSEAECEETSFGNQPSTEVCLRDNTNTGDSVHLQKRVSANGMFQDNVPESTSTQLYRENGEGHVNGLGKEPLQTEDSFAPSVPNSNPLLVEATKEDAISRRTRARYSLANYSLEELETFLQESDDDGNLQNVDEEEEYRRFLASVLSGGGDDIQACQEGETQDEDENDADFELEIEEALESDGGEKVGNKKGRNEKDAHRPQTRKKRPKLPRAVHRQESTKSNLQPILPNSSSALLASGSASRNINVSSSSSVNGAAVVEGFTDEQLGLLHMMIYQHVQLMIQTFSLSVLDPSKQRVAADVKKMIVELVGYRDQALARTNTISRQFGFERQHLQSALSHASQRQWIPLIRNHVMSILDVSPLNLALSYLSDVAAVVMKHRKSLVDSTAEKISSKKEPLFPSPVLSTGKDANNVPQDRSNDVSTASPASTGQLHPKKTLAATLVESTKKETVALVPFDIAKLAQRFYPLLDISLFPRKPPPAPMVHRVLFTDGEDGLLALGILEYNNDWDAIQKRFLPCKSTHQIYVRQKNRSSSNAPDNPVKEVRRVKNSPLSTEEIQRIEEGLQIFKNDWTSVWKFVLPYRDPALLQRQFRVATGVQRSYSKSDALKEKRRSYEAKRRHLKSSMPGSRVARGQEADNGASEGVENDDDFYVNEAFLADAENRSINMTQTGTRPDVHACFEQHNRNGVSASYVPFSSCAFDGPSTKRAFGGTLDELQVSQLGKEKGSHVVKLAPDLPPVNLPPSVRVMSQMEFHENASHFNAAMDLFPVPPPTFTECVYTQLSPLPGRSTSDRSHQHGICNGYGIEDGIEQDFLMHPLLFEYPREVLSSYSHPGENHIRHSRNYDLFPFEESNKQTTDGMEGAPANSDTIDFHPLLQRTEADMLGEVPEKDLDIHLCSSMDSRNAKDLRSTISQSSSQPEGSMKDRASISNLEPGNAFSHHGIGQPSEEDMCGIVMEQEELSDSEEDSQHVEFECEEIDDSEEEQVQDAELCLTGNKGTAKSAVCSDLQERNDQRQIQQGFEQVVKQGASLTHKSRGSSSTRSGRAKLKPERAEPTGTRRSLRLSALRTNEPSQAKAGRTGGWQEEAGVEHKSSE